TEKVQEGPGRRRGEGDQRCRTTRTLPPPWACGTGGFETAPRRVNLVPQSGRSSLAGVEHALAVGWPGQRLRARGRGLSRPGPRDRVSERKSAYFPPRPPRDQPPCRSQSLPPPPTPGTPPDRDSARGWPPRSSPC